MRGMATGALFVLWIVTLILVLAQAQATVTRAELKEALRAERLYWQKAEAKARCKAQGGDMFETEPVEPGAETEFWCLGAKPPTLEIK